MKGIHWLISPQQDVFKDHFTVFNLCMIWLSVGIEWDYSLCGCIFDKEGFSVSSGLVFPLLCLVHTGFSLAPHGSNDPLIILYSDALIKLMCWFYVFNLPWSPTIPSVSLRFCIRTQARIHLPLWSQSPVKSLKCFNSWRLLGPLWFTLSISPCPLSKFTAAKWGTLTPSFPSQRCFQVTPNWVLWL